MSRVAEVLAEVDPDSFLSPSPSQPISATNCQFLVPRRVQVAASSARTQVETFAVTYHNAKFQKVPLLLLFNLLPSL